MISSTVLFVPGLRGYVADHWQTLLAAQLPNAHTVPPLEHNGLSRTARVAALDEALSVIEGPVLLAAHSAGCLIVAHWAAQGGRRPIAGALLATPADIERPLPDGYPTLPQLVEGGWLPLPRQPLPFPSLLAASSNDPLAEAWRTKEMAHDWGSHLIEVGAVGHLNPAGGYGPWPGALALLQVLEEMVDAA